MSVFCERLFYIRLHKMLETVKYGIWATISKGITFQTELSWEVVWLWRCSPSPQPSSCSAWPLSWQERIRVNRIARTHTPGPTLANPCGRIGPLEPPALKLAARVKRRVRGCAWVGIASWMASIAPDAIRSLYTARKWFSAASALASPVRTVLSLRAFHLWGLHSTK